MKLVIKISEDLYENAIKDTYTGIDELDAIVAIKQGTALVMDKEQETNLINLVRALYCIAVNSEKQEAVIPTDVMKKIYQFMESHSDLK